MRLYKIKFSSNNMRGIPGISGAQCASSQSVYWRLLEICQTCLMFNFICLLVNLVHHIPDDDLRPSHIAMASGYVSDRVYERLKVKNQVDLRIFLAASAGADELSVVHGNFFESHTILSRTQGGKYCVRYLDTGVPTSHWSL